MAKDGRTGEWKLCVPEKGYVTSETFIDILQDLVVKLEVDNIPRPVILFLDGASPHISLAMDEYCKCQNIQPWLLKPNSTHLLQPLDLTFFKVLKTKLKQLCLVWQQDLRHIGASLTKYTVVPILRDAAEEVLEKSPGTISSGFRRAGFYPWNPAAVDQAKMIPSTVFAPPSIDTETETVVSRKEVVEHWSGEVLAAGSVGIYGETSPVFSKEAVSEQGAPGPPAQQQDKEAEEMIMDAKTKLKTYELVFLNRKKTEHLKICGRLKRKALNPYIMPGMS